MARVIVFEPETQQLMSGELVTVKECPFSVSHREGQVCPYCKNTCQSAYIRTLTSGVYVAVEDVAFMIDSGNEQEGDIVIYEGTALGIVLSSYESTLKIYNELLDEIQFVDSSEVTVISFLVTELEKEGV